MTSVWQTVSLQKDMADAPQYRSRRWDSLGIAGRYQEFTDSAILRGYAGVAYDALWNRCERSFGTYAMSVQTSFYPMVRSRIPKLEKNGLKGTEWDNDVCDFLMAGLKEMK